MYECSSECRNVGTGARGRKNSAVENVEKTAGGSYIPSRKCHQVLPSLSAQERLILCLESTSPTQTHAYRQIDTLDCSLFIDLFDLDNYRTNVHVHIRTRTHT